MKILFFAGVVKGRFGGDIGEKPFSKINVRGILATIGYN